MVADIEEPRRPELAARDDAWCDVSRVVARYGLALGVCEDIGITLLDIHNPRQFQVLARGPMAGTIAAGIEGRFYVGGASQDVWELAVTH